MKLLVKVTTYYVKKLKDLLLDEYTMSNWPRHYLEFLMEVTFFLTFRR
jgi:hypothetical protein